MTEKRCYRLSKAVAGWNGLEIGIGDSNHVETLESIFGSAGIDGWLDWRGGPTEETWF